jgi:hypothetical protein
MRNAASAHDGEAIGQHAPGKSGPPPGPAAQDRRSRRAALGVAAGGITDHAEQPH